MYLQTRSSPFCLLIYIAPLFSVSRVVLCVLFCCECCAMPCFTIPSSSPPPPTHTTLPSLFYVLAHSLCSLFSIPPTLEMERKIDVIRMCILTNSPVFVHSYSFFRFSSLSLILHNSAQFLVHFPRTLCCVVCFTSFPFFPSLTRLTPGTSHKKLYETRGKTAKKMRKKTLSDSFSYLNKDSRLDFSSLSHIHIMIFPLFCFFFRYV